MTETAKKSERSEDQKKIDKAFLVRPCNAYKEEYKQCQAKFETYSGKANAVYIYGEDYSPADCNKYMEDFRNCKLWRDSYSMEALTKLLEREEEIVLKRSEAMKKNDVWEYRTSPPEDFYADLPTQIKENFVTPKNTLCTIL